jgi:hypothetical protein
VLCDPDAVVVLCGALTGAVLCYSSVVGCFKLCDVILVLCIVRAFEYPAVQR